MTFTIDPRVTMGVVSLVVADLERSLSYYQESIGLRLQGTDDGMAMLGAGERPLLRLREQKGARRVRGVTGLYHYALRVPSRLELARTVKNLAETETAIGGAADHLVSEAFYLSDPDGHGIEIYRDRPREKWSNEEGVMEMDTLSVDFEGIMGEMENDDKPWQGIHPETVMGHVHLHVADLAAADRFYVETMGFEKPALTASIPTASFVSAGGYHHHLGLNIWAGRGAPPPPDDAVRLLHFEILFPDEAALQAVVSRLEEDGRPVSQMETGWMVQDPSENWAILKVAG